MKLSICCITYNHEKYIRKALEGFMSQEIDFDIEIIIADDYSQDKTKEIIHEFVADNPGRIKFIPNQKNLGMVANFKQALSLCQGEYVALCEGDDYWTDPLKLQKQVEFLDCNQDYSLCFSRFKTKNEDSGVFEEDINGHYFLPGNKSSIEFDFEKFLKGWHIGTQTSVFRNEHLDHIEIGKYRYFKDVTLYSILLSKGRGVCLNFFGAVYRKHPGGIYSGVSQLTNARNGYLTYREIYFADRQNAYLRAKFLRFLSFYFDTLLTNNQIRPSLSLALELFYYDLNLRKLLKNLSFISMKNVKT